MMEMIMAGAEVADKPGGAPPVRPGLPRVVRTNHAVRTAAFAFCFVVVGLHFADRGYGPLAWAALALQFLVYPQLVFLRAKHAARPVEAELDNLYIDSALLGAWAAQLGFPSWITVGFLLATSLNATVNRGLSGLLYSSAIAGMGAAVSMAVFGYTYSPDTSRLVSALAFFGALGYACALGNVVYTQSRRLVTARDELRASEERYRLIAENAADLIALVDSDGRWIYVSPAYYKVLHAVDIEPGADAFRRLHPDDADRVRVALLRAVATRQPRELALRLVDRHGRIRQYQTRIQPLDAEPGMPARALLASRDVTDLRESEERLLLAAHALEGMTEAIMITSADGTVLTVNRAFSAITGYERDEVLGRSEREVRNALQPPEFYEDIYATVESAGYWSGSTWCRRKNGSVYREWRSVRAVRDSAGVVTHYVAVFYEVGAPRAAGQAAAP